MAGSAPMLRFFVVLGFVAACLTGSASAQDDADAGAEPTGEVFVDDDTGERYRLRRPPEGMQRGDLAVPAWVPVTGGVLLVVAAAVALVIRARRRSR